MKIFVKVKPNSKIEKIEKINEAEFTLWVNAPAKEGKANQKAIELLSRYFDIAKSRIVIIKGEKCKNKMLEIL